MKYSQEFVESLFKKINYILHSIYKNSNSKLKYTCDFGHQNEVSFNKFKNRNQRCPDCVGNKKYDIKTVEKVFTKQNYILKSTTYKNTQSPLQVLCPNEHVCEISFNSFKSGTRCKKCKIPIKRKPKKYTFVQVQSCFKEKGCILISSEKEYISQQSKLTYMCVNKHTRTSTFSNFLKKKSCGVCYGHLKLTQEFVETAFLKRGYKLNSEYKNSHTKVDVICPKGHNISIRFTDFSRNLNCGICSGKLKHSYKFIKTFIEKEEYKLICKNYINVGTKLNIICPKKHSIYISFESFKNGNRCGVCYRESGYNFEFVEKKFLERNYQLITKEYKNNYTKMKFKCEKGHNGLINFSDFLRGNGCRYCINKTEAILNSFLKEYFNIISEARFKWNNRYRFDFLLIDKKLLIECDGG